VRADGDEILRVSGGCSFANFGGRSGLARGLHAPETFDRVKNIVAVDEPRMRRAHPDRISDTCSLLHGYGRVIPPAARRRGHDVCRLSDVRHRFLRLVARSGSPLRTAVKRALMPGAKRHHALDAFGEIVAAAHKHSGI
jgi:hypothetical protein